LQPHSLRGCEAGNHRPPSLILCLACFPPIHGLRSKPTRSHKAGTSQNGTASNRDNLPQRGLTVAQAVLGRLEHPTLAALVWRPLPAPKPNQDVQPNKQPCRPSRLIHSLSIVCHVWRLATESCHRWGSDCGERASRRRSAFGRGQKETVNSRIGASRCSKFPPMTPSQLQ
jgi:hypothetical protein